VLGEGGRLHLLETGYKLEVRPGDVVSFQARQQLHKLDIATAKVEAKQIVFTIWTDRQAYWAAVSNALPDFYVVGLGDGDDVEGEVGGSDVE
jgi:hypothetical protein